MSQTVRSTRLARLARRAGVLAVVVAAVPMTAAIATTETAASAEQLRVDAANGEARTVAGLIAGARYRLSVSGVYRFSGERQGTADAECAKGDGSLGYEREPAPRGAFELLVDGRDIDWRPTTRDVLGCNVVQHAFTATIQATHDGPLSFSLADAGLDIQRSGELRVEVAGPFASAPSKPTTTAPPATAPPRTAAPTAPRGKTATTTPRADPTKVMGSHVRAVSRSASRPTTPVGNESSLRDLDDVANDPGRTAVVERIGNSGDELAMLEMRNGRPGMGAALILAIVVLGAAASGLGLAAARAQVALALPVSRGLLGLSAKRFQAPSGAVPAASVVRQPAVLRPIAPAAPPPVPLVVERVIERIVERPADAPAAASKRVRPTMAPPVSAPASGEAPAQPVPAVSRTKSREQWSGQPVSAEPIVLQRSSRACSCDACQARAHR